MQPNLISNNVKLFGGSSLPSLSQQISGILNLPLENAVTSKFSDGEVRIELMEYVRGSEAYIIQSTCSPVNDNLMELILLADALKRASVKCVTAVIPYFGYARQDRRPGYSRVPISARVVADLIQSAGIDHMLTVDIHALQIEGFFKIPVDNISATNVFSADIFKHNGEEDIVVVSPDVGGVARARAIAKDLHDADLAIVDKRRPRANVSEVMNIIGDVKDKTCIIIDDMVDTAGTLCKAADALVRVGGAKRVVAYATHGVLSGKAAVNIANSELSELVITDSIPPAVQIPKVRYISLANILAETINRISTDRSISIF
jgi:ribose-phosphate pyrophosphokinase